MAYDAHRALDALERPELTVPRGWLGRKVVRLVNLLPGIDKPVETKTYTGRILSHPEWRPIQERLTEIAAQEEPDEDEIYAVWKDYLNRIGIPWDVVFDLPGRAIQEAMRDFLACQNRAEDVRDLPGVQTATPSETPTPSGTRKTPTEEPVKT